MFSPFCNQITTADSLTFCGLTIDYLWDIEDSTRVASDEGQASPMPSEIAQEQRQHEKMAILCEIVATH